MHVYILEKDVEPRLLPVFEIWHVITVWPFPYAGRSTAWACPYDIKRTHGCYGHLPNMLRLELGADMSLVFNTLIHGTVLHNCFQGIANSSTHFPCFFLQDLPVRNLVDCMHVEKNVAENLLRTLFGEKDGPSVRLDLRRRNIRRHLWMRGVPGQDHRAFIPEAPWVLTKEQRGIFLDTLKNMKLPSHYSSFLHGKISSGKLMGLKSHDYHVLLQDLMPLCMRSCGCEHMTAVVIRVSRLFKKICNKKVDIAEQDALFEECAETLCLLEKQLPPSFFDIMIHLCIHLVEELFICGPVHVRWMYPFERYYKTLKGYVRNHAKPEGCMAKRYELEESCGFASEYLGAGQSSVKRVWESEEDPTMNDIFLEGKGKVRILDQALLEEIHDFVIDNVDIVEPYRE